MSDTSTFTPDPRLRLVMVFVDKTLQHTTKLHDIWPERFLSAHYRALPMYRDLPQGTADRVVAEAVVGLLVPDLAYHLLSALGGRTGHPVALARVRAADFTNGSDYARAVLPLLWAVVTDSGLPGNVCGVSRHAAEAAEELAAHHYEQAVERAGRFAGACVSLFTLSENQELACRTVVEAVVAGLSAGQAALPLGRRRSRWVVP